MTGGLSGWRPARKLKTEQSSLRVKGRQAMPSKPEHSGYPLPGAGVALAVACLAYFTPNYAQFQASPFGGVIMERFSIDPGQFSLLFTSPMIPAIFLSLVAGTLIDKLGPRLVVGAGMAVSAAGCVIRVFANSYAVLLAGTALTGFAGCFITVGAAKVLAGYYGPEGGVHALHDGGPRNQRGLRRHHARFRGLIRARRRRDGPVVRGHEEPRSPGRR